jgi:hypothetical protein
MPLRGQLEHRWQFAVDISLVHPREGTDRCLGKVKEASPSVGRPVLVCTAAIEKPVVAFLSTERVWYAGGALSQSSMTVMGDVSSERCEPDGEERL